MGNTFCKIGDSTYFADKDKNMVNCLPYDPMDPDVSINLNVPGTYAGKCYSYDTPKMIAVVKDALANKQPLTPSLFKEQEVLRDTGITCNYIVTQVNNGTDLNSTTNASAVPSGYLQAKRKDGVDPEKFKAFEALYTTTLSMLVEQPEKLPDFQQQHGEMFTFSMVPNATNTSPSPLSSQEPATTPAPPAPAETPSPTASTSSVTTETSATKTTSLRRSPPPPATVSTTAKILLAILAIVILLLVAGILIAVLPGAITPTYVPVAPMAPVAPPAITAPATGN
jgi:hypothetical protein